MVSQEPWLVAGSIEQNIILGSPDATTEDLLWAGKLCGVSNFTDEHPKGYKMLVGERGEGLSGGQRQSVTIARALVKRPPIFLFDEPTSAMDARSERTLIENLQNHRFEGTMIVITHRTSLLALVDRVLVLDNGKIVGEGSVEAFLKAGLKNKAEPRQSNESTS